MEIARLSLSPDDIYDTDMIDKRIFIGEPNVDDIFNRFFRKKDLKKLYKLFLEQIIPFAKKIMDILMMKVFVGSNDFIPERHCIRGRIRLTFLWYLTWSGGNIDNLRLMTCMLDVSFFLDHLKYIADLRYEDISQDYVNHINSMNR
ncbi:39044_t:CDS:2 [Gigaspora margarita]|uniref:39044_t:CDS:1 n=1 Tax=Gigaspora margarita TaxID=4874 RepID=A0ABN7UWD1_GIGMA|nr:39044_t:CDS:2 [Gigaspora margarita]